MIPYWWSFSIYFSTQTSIRLLSLYQIVLCWLVIDFLLFSDVFIFRWIRRLNLWKSLLVRLHVIYVIRFVLLFFFLFILVFIIHFHIFIIHLLKCLCRLLGEVWGLRRIASYLFLLLVSTAIKTRLHLLFRTFLTLRLDLINVHVSCLNTIVHFS